MAEATAKQVAETILRLCQEREIKDVSNLKLQKLLYYAQAWYLSLCDEPLFDEPIEAWVHGPVVRRVFADYRDLRWSPIPAPTARTFDSPDIEEFISGVLNQYGHFTATQLELLTHKETPWAKTRDGLAPDEPSRREIAQDLIKEFYSQIKD